MSDGEEQHERWGHIRCVEGDKVHAPPEFVHIVAIGQHFMEGVAESIRECAKATVQAGFSVGVEVIRDVSIRPNEGVPAMRNWAAMAAMEKKADYLFMLDNDFLLDDPQTLVKLLSHRRLAVAPFYNQSLVHGQGEAERISDPMLQPGQGLVPINWVSINVILFDTTIFRLVGTELFTGPLITNKEDYVFLRLRNAGVQLWQDTDTVVQMLRPPTKTWQNLGEKNPNPNTKESRENAQRIMEIFTTDGVRPDA